MEPWVFYMCNVSCVSHKKTEGGGGLFCHMNQSCWKLYEMDISSPRFFLSLAVGGGGVSARSPMRCSMMHEIQFGKVTSHHKMQFGKVMLHHTMHEIWFSKVTSKLHHVTRCEPSISPKGGGGAFRPICVKLRFCLLNTVVYRIHNERLTSIV